MINILLLLGTVLLIFSSFALFAGMVVGGVHILFSLILLCFGRDVEATLQSLERHNHHNDNHNNQHNIMTASSYRRQQQQQRLVVGLEGGGAGRAAPMPEYRIRVKYPISANPHSGDLQFVTKTFVSKNWNALQDLQLGEIVLVRIWTRHCPGWAELSADLLPLKWKLSSLAVVVTTVMAVVYVWFLHKVVFDILPAFLVSYGINDELSRFCIKGVCILLVPIYVATTIYTLTRTDNDAESVLSYHHDEEEQAEHILTPSSSSRPTMRFSLIPHRLAMATRNVISKIWQSLESEKYHHHQHHSQVRNPGSSNAIPDAEEDMREMLPQTTQRRRIASPRDFV